MSKIKACFAQSSALKTSFKGSVCALPISVGQPYHEAGKMLATMDLVNKYFSKCIIIVCDSLQRHNATLYCNEKEIIAYEKAIETGAQWLERNADAFKRLTIPYEVVRWDNWYKNKKFPIYLKKIEDLLHTDIHFAKMVNDCACRFVEQHFAHYDKNIFSKPLKVIISICESYLKEEAAVLLMWYDYENYNFLAYPGSNNEVMTSIYERFIKQNGVNKLVSLKIKFKNK